MEDAQTYLIVDDDADDIEFFCEAIDKIDATGSCHSAGNGEEALRWLRQKSESKPDYIFLDLNMPRMDGRACLGELKKDDGLRDIPVIVYTTSSHQRDRGETMALGADYFLVKATSFKKLCDDIERAVTAVRKNKSSKSQS